MTLAQMRLWLREGMALDRIKWKQTVIAMRLSQADPDDLKEALRDD
jgi:hypothetical protein